ncbi:MAG: membrane protein insertion efficiency factor YidD [Candidatus Margulisiibacteriota bacterium]
MKRLSLILIRFYQKAVSPLLSRSCRYHPSCSDYCEEAIERYGFFKGGSMGLLRILRCNQLFKGGPDPVK